MRALLMQTSPLANGKRSGQPSRPSKPRVARRRSAFAGPLLEGLREALAHAEGCLELPVVRYEPTVDVAATRLRLNLTQADFARTFRVPLATLRAWEQGTRQPSGPAAAYMTVVAREPVAVLRALGDA